jgi:hypothetical protein
MMVLDSFCSTVPPKMVPTFAKKETAKEVENAITTMRVANDSMKKATMHQLYREFNTTFNDGETVVNYTLCLSCMVAHLTMLCEEVKDTKVIAKMLLSWPHHNKHITIEIKTILEVSTMCVAELTRRLKEVEVAFEEALMSLQQDGKLLLTEEEWYARRKKHEWEKCTSGSARRDRIGKGWWRGHVHDGSSLGESLNKPIGIECRCCSNMGHWVLQQHGTLGTWVLLEAQDGGDIHHARRC